MVSPLTLLSVRPSSKLTSAAYSSVQKVSSLPKFLGSWWRISRSASTPSASKAVCRPLGREEPAIRASKPFSLKKSWMAFLSVCDPQRKFSAIRGGRSPRALARRIWQNDEG
jgi:hypothetical protein